jgi:MoaA/NifB/PqqE/SkfB family radical SAM enzyme
MGVLFAWPSELKTDAHGLALTFIVPATACNLSCGFCAIKQRHEISESTLSVADYGYFLSEIARKEPLAIAAVQGYEPLLAESWRYTSQLLSTARRCGVPRSIVTNGILLTERASELAELEPTGVTISIDSSTALAHDKIRGVGGAFEKTLAGLRALSNIPGFASRITVNSVLFPHRRKLLEGMPALLEQCGITHWVVGPLLRIGRNTMGGPVGDSGQIIDDLLHLRGVAENHGVSVVLDDELGMLALDFQELVVRRFERPEGLIRLAPDGSCSVGRDILRAVSPKTPRWNPSKMEPLEFVRSILSPAMRADVFREAA